jgi:hypothetical protein
VYGNYNGGYGVSPYQQQLAQQRMSQIEQQYNVGAYPQNNYQMQSNQMGTLQTLKGRPVSSFDEAKASMIDLDGSLYVFTDLSNNCIYTKQILLDGSAELKTYVLQEQKQKEVETKQTEEKSVTYVLKKDFDKTVRELKKQIEVLKGEVSYDSKNDEPNAKK